MAGPVNNDPPGNYLYATVAIPDVVDGDTVAPLWEADLVAGAVAEKTAVSSKLTDSVAGTVETGQLPDGSLVQLGGGAGRIASGQQLKATSDSILLATTRKTLTAAGLIVVTVRVLHPLGPALYIVAQAQSIDQMSNGGLVGIVEKLAQDPICCDGVYFELQNPDGRIDVRASTSYRNGTGTFWSRPGATVNVGITHG